MKKTYWIAGAIVVVLLIGLGVYLSTSDVSLFDFKTVEKLSQTVDSVKTRLNASEERIKSMDKQLQSIDKEYLTLKRRYESDAKRLNDLSSKQRKEIDRLKEDLFIDLEPISFERDSIDSMLNLK